MSDILVIINPQNDFIEGSLSTEESIKVLPNIINVIKQHINFNDPIFIVQDTHTKNYKSTPEGKGNPIPHCLVKTNGWKINDKIQATLELANPGYVRLVQKETFGSFDLIKQLKDTVRTADERVREIILIGYQTNIDVLNNAVLIKNNFKNIKTTVLSYACSGSTVDLHEQAIEVMKSTQINVIGL
jgi:nicotinamidase-related amidase